MLLPSDTCRKPIMSITALLLLFVTYLLTLPSSYKNTALQMVPENKMSVFFKTAPISLLIFSNL
jgi:hypothetical protein